MSEQSSVSEAYRKQFLAAFDSLVKELTEDEIAANPELEESLEYFEEVLKYNALGGKCNRGLMVIGSLLHLAAGRKLTQVEEKKAIILGWCVELLQAFFLVADDIMDQSKTRRGKPCWYLKEGVGLMAINDSLGIGLSVFRILRKHFREESYYADLVDLFHDIAFRTEMGQTLDLLTATSHVSDDEELDFSQYTLERYQTIVKHKTGYYSFYLPVALAMYMVGISDKNAHMSAQGILLSMGEFFQIQDDYLDCYGDPEVTGKVGTDIQDCKCTWLVIQALNKSSTEQLKILKTNYGQCEPECVARVKHVYEELDLKSCFKSFEEESYKHLISLIQEQSVLLPKQLFIEFSDRIYKREK